MPEITAPFLQVQQPNLQFYLTTLPANAIVAVSYAAVRKPDAEEGAVQRVLNPSRISSVKEFTLKVGHYPGTIVLNWKTELNPLVIDGSNLKFELVERCAQLIDGQHRVAGIKAAIAEQAALGEMRLPVAIYTDLSTQACADIFLSINTEQKSVPRSLVFDLYGVASEPMIDPVGERARDIAYFLNDATESPYQGLVKLPGSPPRKGGIALSTIVTALKPLISDKGTLDQIGVTELELQKKVLLNYFLVLHEKCGEFWEHRDNALRYGAGFAGALTFFMSKLVPYCNNARSFEQNVIAEPLNLNPQNAPRQSDLKGKAGGEASATVAKSLSDLFTPANPTAELRI
jgi:DGQHR domain-containing protein